jgi:hypothetical protein
MISDILVGYGGLAISFVIFAVIFLLILIKANNISFKLKFLMVPLVLAYSIVLYSTVQNFLGYPTEKAGYLKEVIVLSFHVDEGDAIYFWVIKYNKENVVDRFFPTPPEAIDSDAPVYVKIKYNSKLHKQLMEAIAKAEASKRDARIKMDMNKLRGLQSLRSNESPFDLFDPLDVMRKGPEE